MSLLAFVVVALLFSQAEVTAQENSRPWQKFLSKESIQLKLPPLKSMSVTAGIPIYLMEDGLLPLTSFKIVIENGQFRENKKNSGITNLWGESIVYSGSQKMPREKLVAFFEQRGSKLGFSASLESCEFSITSLKHFALEDIAVLFEILASPRFDAEDVSLTKKQMQTNIKKLLENPARIAFMMAKKVLWPENPRGVLTSVESLESLQPGDLRAWHQQQLQSSGVYFQISGDYDEKIVLEFLQNQIQKMQLFSSAKKPFVAKPELALTLTGDKKKGIYAYHKDIPQTTLLWKARGINQTDKDYYAYKIVDFILGGDSFNATLMQKIRVENGWAYSAYSYFETSRYWGDMNIFIQTKNENVAKVIAKVNEILGKPEEFLSEIAIERAKQSLQNKFVFLYENSGQLLEQQLGSLSLGLDENYLKEYLENIKKQTLADVLAVARKYYRPENYTLFYVGPEIKGSGVKVEQTIEKLFE